MHLYSKNFFVLSPAKILIFYSYGTAGGCFLVVLCSFFCSFGGVGFRRLRPELSGEDKALEVRQPVRALSSHGRGNRRAAADMCRWEVDVRHWEVDV